MMMWMLIPSCSLEEVRVQRGRDTRNRAQGNTLERGPSLRTGRQIVGHRAATCHN